MNQAPYSDFKVYAEILNQLPDNIQLQVANSSAIRYVQLFKNKPKTDVFCNRGTSGIDGSTSTAIGAAVANPKPTVLLTGDISFFYDANALWNNYIPKNFKIILVNNSGGGIFRILLGHQETETFNTFFETQHNRTAEYLAEMYGFTYHKAFTINELTEIFPEFLNTNKQPQLIEIFTPEKINDIILKDYFKNLQ